MDALLRQSKALGMLDRCEFVPPYHGEAEKSAFMNSLDVLVHPSFAEGTPNTIVEAMRHGLPIVASAVGGIPDMLSPECGMLVNPGEPNQLANAMIHLAADRTLRSEMGASARRRYEELFSPTAVLPVLVSCYERIIAAKGQNRMTPIERNQPHPWSTMSSDKSELMR
jgi:glycosyltransferase involved in cell wall biosynthesis